MAEAKGRSIFGRLELVRLSVRVKTTNGSGTLTGLDAEDSAAFAAEITGP